MAFGELKTNSGQKCTILFHFCLGKPPGPTLRTLPLLLLPFLSLRECSSSQQTHLMHGISPKSNELSQDSAPKWQWDEPELSPSRVQWSQADKPEVVAPHGIKSVEQSRGGHCSAVRMIQLLGGLSIIIFHRVGHGDGEHWLWRASAHLSLPWQPHGIEMVNTFCV